MRLAVVLADGKKLAHGQPNALLRFEPLISHRARAMKPDFDDIVAAASEQELPFAGARCRMKCPFRGPIGAIYYGLKAPHQ
jgi:molybdopterin-guanine dinucleotide biosynthesis protein A